MKENIKLILARSQVENLISLLEENEYQQFLYSHLIQVQFELKRQLTNLSHSSTIKK